MTAVRLTPHQKWALERLERLSRPIVRDGLGAPITWRWVHVKDTGCPAAMEHLVRKGYADLDVARGPRGGEHRYYRPVSHRPVA